MDKVHKNYPILLATAAVILLLIFVFLPDLARGQSIEERIAALGLVESQRSGNYMYGESGFRSFYVSKSDQEILIREPRLVHERAYPPEYAIDSGSYIGTDDGEFLGELIFESNEGDREVVLDDINVYSIVPYGRSLFVMTGWEHLAHTGQVFWIRDTEFPTQIEKYTELPDPPVETLLVNYELIIVGHDSITKLIPFKVMALNPFKGILVTSAVQVDDDTLLVGLWSGLAVVKMSNSGWKSTVFVMPEYRN